MTPPRAREEFLHVFSAGQRPTEMAALPLAPEALTALDLLLAARPGFSRSTVRRLGEGGVSLEDVRLRDPEELLQTESGAALRAGRRRRFRITLRSS